MRTATTIVLAGILATGCASIYTTPAISDLDDNDLKVVVRSNDSKATIEGMLPVAKTGAERGCERFGKQPEYISHAVLQKRTGTGGRIAEALVKPAWAPSQAKDETIVQFLFACVQAN